MNRVDFASFLKAQGTSGTAVNSGGNAKPASPFSEYLRKVNYKIDANENKLISDYKSKYVENTPAKSNTENLNQSSKFVQYQRNDRDSQVRSQSSQRYSPQADSSDRSVADNRVSPYANNNINANNQSVAQSSDNNQSRKRADGSNIGEVKTLRGSDVLTPQTDAKVNLISKVVLANQVNASSTTSDDLTSNPSQDLAVEDNFLLASLVYKVFNIMSETGATDGTTMQGSNLKDFMEIIKQLPQDKLNELRSLIDPENLDITTEDKSNVDKIKDILLTTKYVIADNGEMSDDIAQVKPEGFGKVDEDKINQMTAQMLAENGLVNSKQAVNTNVATANEDEGVVAKIGSPSVDDIPSKVEPTSIKAIIEEIRKQKAEEELEKYKQLLGIKDDEDGEKLDKVLNGSENLADVKETNKKFGNITDELLNTILAKLKGVATSLQDTANRSLQDEILKLMDKGMSDDEIVNAIVPMIEDDEKLFTEMIDRLVADVELKDGNFVKVDKEAVASAVKAEVQDSTPKSYTNEILKNLINSSNQQASKEVVGNQTDKLTTKDAPQIAQSIPTKTDAKPESENKANLMKSYEELKLQIEKVVNGSAGSNGKGDFAQSDKKQQQAPQLTALKPNTESQLKELTSSNVAQSKTADSSLDFNTQLKNLSDAKSDKPQQMVDSKQATYNVKDPKDIQRLFKTLEQSVVKGESKVTVSLTPENLGKMEIRLVENAGKITAKFFTESETSHKLIMSQAELFKNQLSEKGITIDNMEFSFNDPSTKQGKDSDRRTAKNGSKKDTEGGNVIERDKNINFRSRASRAGGLYA